MKTQSQIVSKSVLVATMENNTDVQLRQEKDFWWMISPKTGTHCVISETLSERVRLHWEGFKINQTR
jgi:hypothetical protein